MDDSNDSVKGRAKGGVARSQKLTSEQKTKIAREAAIARWGAPGARAEKPIKNKLLSHLVGGDARAPVQGELDLQIEKQIEIDGVGMGVLSDGTAFLTGRGLARLCGVDSSRISEMAQDWSVDAPNAMTAKVKQILEEKGIIVERPYIEIKQRSGVFHAYPDVLCLAVLEYYAFDLPKDEAKKNFRLLAGKALHDFIYTQVGYDPSNIVPVEWQQFHDRVSLTYNSVPPGYFSIFKEISDMVVTLGQGGLHIDSSFVPDISVGGAWGKHWTSHNLDNKYGARKKWDHNYPDYFPQALSNPQPAWCYPDEALAEFRRWMRETYVGEGKFISYIESKVQQKQLPPSFTQLAIAAYNLGDD